MTRPLPVWHLEAATPSSRVLVFQDNNLVYPDAPMEEPLFVHEQVALLGQLEAEPLLVAQWQGEDIYAAHLVTTQDALPSRSVRQLLSKGPRDLAALASTAIQLLHWQRDNRYCGRCGNATRLLEKERARYCEPCKHRFFPRLSPCVIVAIRKAEQILLAQSHHFPDDFYSLIAGFIEPGESAEEAVHRETAEETGLRVNNVRYIASEPWAFPHQLMLGYLADYESGELILEEAELADANWFSADDLPQVPGEWTIAGRLIRLAFKQCALEDKA